MRVLTLDEMEYVSGGDGDDFGDIGGDGGDGGSSGGDGGSSVASPSNTAITFAGYDANGDPIYVSDEIVVVAKPHMTADDWNNLAWELGGAAAIIGVGAGVLALAPILAPAAAAGIAIGGAELLTGAAAAPVLAAVSGVLGAAGLAAGLAGYAPNTPVKSAGGKQP